MLSAFRVILVLVMSVFLSACTKVGLFTANVPAVFNGATVSKDISYGDEAMQVLDIYAPKAAQEHPAPVIVFFYGGRWTDGRKKQYKFVADAFVDEGYLVVIPDYRKYPSVKFPAFVEDGAAALAWVYNNIERYGGDAGNLFVAGHSSGAHIGALVVTDPGYLASHDMKRHVVKGFAGLSGPYAFTPEAEDLKDMFGPPERYPLMRAPNYVDGRQPPMLLIHGLDDETVVLKNAQNLAGAVREKGGDLDLVTYENIDHVETIGSLMWFWSYKTDMKDKMTGFFKRHIEK